MLIGGSSIVWLCMKAYLSTVLPLKFILLSSDTYFLIIHCGASKHLLSICPIHPVGGAAGAASRITGTLGKGIAALTFDDDYQKKRRQQLNKRPANAREGFARGGKGLIMVR